MKKSIIAAGFLLGAACAGVVMLETRPAPDDAVEPTAGSGASRAAAEPPAQAETGLDRARRWETAILARPLFNSDRRPLGPAPAAAAADAGLPRLTGIMITPNGRSAIFAPAGGGKPVAVAEGGSLGSYVVRTISLGEVVLTGPDGIHTLNPTLDHMRPAGENIPPVVMGQAAVNAAPSTETSP